MYSDERKKRAAWLLPVLLLLLALVVLLSAEFHGSGRNLSESSAAAIQAAVERSALQCYVVEGVYPPDLAYLEDNYGLQINTRDYYVTYDAFASNLPPIVRVTNKR